MTNEGYFILLNDEFGRKVADNVNAQYKGPPAALTSNPKTNHPFVESSPFKLFAIDAVARTLDARVMLPEEAQMLVMLDRMPKTTPAYKDLALAMDFSGRDHKLALNLYDRLYPEQKNLDRFPALFTGLKPVKSDTGKYGLAFEVMSYTEMRTAK